jgi:PAS domain S-box-containing protein
MARSRWPDIRPAVALGWAVLAVAVIELVDHLQAARVGPPLGTVLLGILGTGLLVAAGLERSGRPRLATMSVVALLLAVAAVGGLLYPDRASSGFAALIAFALFLPHLRRGQTALAAVLCAVAAGPLAIIAEGPLALHDPARFLDIGLATGAATGFVALILTRQKTEHEALVDRYATMVEDMPLGIFRSTPDGRLLDVNRAFVDLLGYPNPATLLEVRVPELAGAREHLATRPRDDDPDLVVGEVLLRRQDRTTIWVRHHTRRIRGSGGTTWLEGVVRDITAERASRLAAERLAALVDSADDAIVGKSLEGTVRSWNAAAERIYGWTAEEMIGASIERIIPPAQRAERLEYLQRLRSGQSVERLVTERVHRDGRVVMVSLTAWPVRDEERRVIGAATIERDVTEQRHLEAQLERRAQAHERVLHAIRRLAPGSTPEETAQAICREIAATGDLAYTAVMALPARSEPLMLAAAGGERGGMEPFAVGAVHPLRPHLRSSTGVTALRPDDEGTCMRRLWEMGVRNLAHVVIEVDRRPVGLLFAGATSACEPELRDMLSSLVDFGAMAAPLLGPQLARRDELALARERLTRVISEEAFVPVFQPVVDIRTRTVVGYEALTRFTDGQTPDRVFAEAGAVGLGLELEVATLRAALAASAPLPANAFLDLNVSPSLILAIEPLRAILRRWGWRVILEITEHDPVDDYDALRRALEQLGPNVRLAVDDAGAGFATLKHIVELRPSFIKLDRGLINGIAHDRARQGLVAGMRHFAASIDCRLVAEGVETEEEAAMLLSLGVGLGQGFLFGRPRPAAYRRSPLSRRNRVNRAPE